MTATCHTFDTPEEALAFMLGFHAAASETILVGIDPQDPQTILVDLEDDDDESLWLRVIAEHKEAKEAP